MIDFASLAPALRSTWPLVAVAALVAAVALPLVLARPAAATTPAGSAPAMMDAKTAHEKASAGELVLIDIRTPMEWRETGIPASAHAVTMNQDPKTFLATLDGLIGNDKSKPFAVICRTGNRSSHLAGQLRQIGYLNVIDVGEGMAGSRFGLGWARMGLPTRPFSEAAHPQVAGTNRP